MLVENDPNHNQTTPTPPVLSFVSPFLILTTHSTTSPHTSLSDPYHPPTPHTHTHTHTQVYAAAGEAYTKQHREALYRHLDDRFSRMAPFPPGALAFSSTITPVCLCLCVATSTTASPTRCACVFIIHGGLLSLCVSVSVCLSVCLPACVPSPRIKIDMRRSIAPSSKRLTPQHPPPPPPLTHTPLHTPHTTPPHPQPSGRPWWGSSPTPPPCPYPSAAPPPRGPATAAPPWLVHHPAQSSLPNSS